MTKHNIDDVLFREKITSIDKQIAEMSKLNEETRLYVKKNRYFEITIVLAAFAAGAAWVKLFL